MYEQHVLELVGRGADQFNEWRRTSPDAYIDLRGASISSLASKADLDLNGIDLSGANLEWADLSGLTMVGASMRGARLRHASLRGSRFDQVDFSEADITGANLAHSALARSVFRYSRMNEANLSDSDSAQGNFESASLKSAVMDRCRFLGARFDHADLSHASMVDAKFAETTFRGATLTLIDGRGASFIGSDMTGAQLYRARLSGASLRGAALDHARLRGAQLDNVDSSNISSEGISASRDQISALMPSHPDAETVSDRRAISESYRGSYPVVMGSPNARSEQGPPVVTVWFGTNRAKVTGSADQAFTGERSAELSYGKCTVSVRGNSLGASSHKKLVRALHRLFFVSRVRGSTLISSECLHENAFAEDLGKTLALLPEEDRRLLVYVHGYNVSFEDAATRAAQLHYDLNGPGITTFFSWPSKAQKRAYIVDGATEEASTSYFLRYLDTLASAIQPSGIDILAHSMGGRLVLRGIQHALGKPSFESGIGHLILAAPDVDRDVFMHSIGQIAPDVRRATLYVSSEDLALAGSVIVNRYPRAGFVPPATVHPELDTIDATLVDFSMLGHSWFGDVRLVLSDINVLRRADLIPGERGLHRTDSADPTVWTFGQ